MNIPRTFYDKLVELDREESEIHGFPYPIIAELNDRARLVVAGKLNIPFPIPKYALIRNGILVGNGDRVRPKDGNKLQYSLFSEVDRKIRVSLKSNQDRTFRILSKSPYLVLQGGRIWTTHTYHEQWFKNK